MRGVDSMEYLFSCFVVEVDGIEVEVAPFLLLPLVASGQEVACMGVVIEVLDAPIGVSCVHEIFFVWLLWPAVVEVLRRERLCVAIPFIDVIAEDDLVIIKY